MDGFKILSEFRFDVGNAMVNSEKLQGAVDQVSNSANQANLAFQSFSTGLVGQFNLMNFSVFSLLKTAMDSTNSFQESTKSFAQLMATNMNYLQGPVQSFNDKLAVSKTLMEDMITRAGRIGISPTAFVAATHGVASSLIPQGLAGKNFGNAQSLGALGVQAGKPLGMDGAQVGKEIGALVVGKDVGGSLMNALIGSSKTFAQFKGSIEDFTALSGTERIKILTQGLKELNTAIGATGNEIVTFSDITDRLRDMVYGLGSVLRPIGDVIFPIVMNAVKEFSDKFQKFAPIIGKQIAGIMQDLAGNPKETLLNLNGLKHLGGDFSAAKDIVGIVGILDLLFMGLKKLGYLKGGLGTIIMTFIGESFVSGLKGSLGFLKGMMSFEGLMKIGGVIHGLANGIGTGLTILRIAFVEILFPLAFVVTLFQTIRKALDIVKMEQAIATLNQLPQVIESFHTIEMAAMKIIAPFLDFIDVMSKALAQMILSVSGADSWADMIGTLAEGLDFLGDAVVVFMAGLHGVVAGIIQLVGDLMNMKFGGISGRVKGAMNDSMDDYLNKHLKGVDDGKNVSNQITNIGKVEIKNDFKDNVEPDRIAFTMKDQLLKAAQNRTQSRGNSIHKGFAK